MLSFPIQVIMFHPSPSIFPYIGLLVIMLLTTSPYRKKNLVIFRNNQKTNQMISVFATLVIFHGTWQVGLGFISVSALISSLVIYLLPILFYIYFSKYAIEKEIPNLDNRPKILRSVTPIPKGNNVSAPKIIELYITTIDMKKSISMPNAKNPQ